MDINLVDEIERLFRKSHAGWVLVAVAVLENSLQQLLLIRMRTLSNKKAKAIFKSGPLRSFAATIDLAWAFELIDPSLHRDLTIIREIRNEFAHSVTQVDFHSPEVLKLVKSFRGWNGKDAAAFEFFAGRVNSCVEQVNAKQEHGLMVSALHGK